MSHILFYFAWIDQYSDCRIVAEYHCDENNIHKLDDALIEDFTYSCDEFRVELHLQIWDGMFCLLAALIAIIGLITLKPFWLIPVIVYGIGRVIYLLVLIFMFSDWVNVSGIIGVLFSIAWTLIFYNTRKIMKKVNEEWETIELMKPCAQSL